MAQNILSIIECFFLLVRRFPYQNAKLVARRQLNLCLIKMNKRQQNWHCIYCLPKLALATRNAYSHVNHVRCRSALFYFNDFGRIYVQYTCLVCVLVNHAMPNKKVMSDTGTNLEFVRFCTTLKNHKKIVYFRNLLIKKCEANADV